MEKPDAATAQSYLDTGRYYWNAGIFLARADTLLDSLGSFAPDIPQAVEKALSRPEWTDPHSRPGRLCPIALHFNRLCRHGAAQPQAGRESGTGGYGLE